MAEKVRFNCMMNKDTRQRLHEIALLNNRSDSNMVAYLIDNYKKNTNVVREMKECGEKR